MKTTVLIFSLFLVASSMLSQPQLVFGKHAVQAGDSYRLRIGEYVEPGLSGRSRLWDFSKVQLSDNWLSDSIHATGSYLSLDRNNGSAEILNVTTNKVEAYGYMDQAAQVTFDTPVTKYTFPFSFANTTSVNFTGKYSVNSLVFNTKGNITTTYDGYGNLLLPDGRSLTNALRTKTTQTRIINYCINDTITEEKYDWYTADFRYPVFTIMKKYTRIGTNTADTTQYCLLSSDFTTNLPTLLPNNEMGNAGRYKYSVTPNPESGGFLIRYSLLDKTMVRLNVFTALNSKVASPVNGLLQDNGDYMYTFQPRVAGVYLVCFSFNSESYTTKIVNTK